MTHTRGAYIILQQSMAIIQFNSEYEVVTTNV